jgi:hypothetical protein
MSMKPIGVLVVRRISSPGIISFTILKPTRLSTLMEKSLNAGDYSGDYFGFFDIKEYTKILTTGNKEPT